MIIFMIPTIVTFFAGLYMIFCRPSLKRTSYIIKKFEIKMPVHKIAELNHKGIDSFVGYYRLILSALIFVAGIGFEYSRILLFIGLVSCGCVYFATPKRFKQFIFNEIKSKE